MILSRETILSVGQADIQQAVDNLAATVRKTHAEIICEAIHKVVIAVETHRVDCDYASRYIPGVEPITNGDIVHLLRLRVAMADAYSYWKGIDDGQK